MARWGPTPRTYIGRMKQLLFALCLSLAGTAASAEVLIEDAYARVSRPGAPTGAVFMLITNTGDAPVTLVAVETEVAARAELHTHIDAGEGVMQMREVESGFEISAGETHSLMRGGDHVMLMGLTERLEEGDTLPLTLIFDGAEPVTLDVTLDNQRADSDP